jgi:hypothetical protein
MSNARPLLRSAAIGAVSLLTACAAGQPDPLPLPGNPKGTRYQGPEPFGVSGQVLAPAGAVGSVVLTVEDGADPTRVVAQRIVSNPVFPLDFSFTQFDLLPEVPSDDLPFALVVRARLDADGQPTTSSPDEPTASARTTSNSQVVRLELAVGSTTP